MYVILPCTRALLILQRLHDNEALSRAHAESSHVVHVYCFDPHWFGSTHFGFPKTGPHRARFLLESILSLRCALEAKGSQLLLRCGKASTVIPALAKETAAGAVYAQQEVCSEELAIDAAVQHKLSKLPGSPPLVFVWGGTMYDLRDLPFDPSTDIQDVFTAFRKVVEKNCEVRPPLPTPETFKPPPSTPLDCDVSIPSAFDVTVPALFGEGAEALNTAEGVLPSLGNLRVPGLPPIAPFQDPPSVSKHDPPATVIQQVWTKSASMHVAAAGGAAIAAAGKEEGAGATKGPLCSPCSHVTSLPGGIKDPGAVSGGTDAPSSVSLLARLPWGGKGCSDVRSVHGFVGGEAAAVARMQGYIWQRDNLKEYKETRNGMVGADYSSKFSPWLAFGNLSPRLVHWHVGQYEAKRVANKSTYWLLFELIWRDFFRFSALKWGTSMFKLGGPQRNAKGGQKWLQDPHRLRAFVAGVTGYPFVDANMRELAATGFMSNRGRQNVASFFVKDLDMDWRLGAELFESLLIDHDPASNYGNWTYQAGVGADPRQDRYFLIPKQSKNYDGRGEFMRLWCPELAGAPIAALHDPRQALLGGAGNAKDALVGAEKYVYPRPIVTLMAQRDGGGGGGRGGGAGRAQGGPGSGGGSGKGGPGGSRRQGGGGDRGGRRKRGGRVQHDAY